MSTLDKKYTIKLDTKNSSFNTVPIFSLSDNETSDFNLRITNANKIINLQDVIVVIVAINPNNEMLSDFVEVEKAQEGLLYCNLKQQFKNITGLWNARLMLIYQNEKVVTGTFSYKVNNDEFIQLNELTLNDDRFPVLTDLVSRLSSIEIQENNRQGAEISRVEAEKQREINKQQLISYINKLIADTNLKVDNNLSEQSDKVNRLIADTNNKIDTYKIDKDLAITKDLEIYKTNTTQEIQDFKNNKSIEVSQDLAKYKNDTTADIEAYKNSKNAEINQYKTEKDLQIDTHISAKNTELDKYVSTKNAEINEYKDLKDTLINDKLREVDTAEASRVQAENLRQQQHISRETFLNSFETRLVNTETTNTTQNTRLTNIETKNKVQDVYISGLFNENNDKRLTVEGTGNTLTLTGSKKGMVTVDKVVGDTFVSLMPIKDCSSNGTSFDNSEWNVVNGSLNISNNVLTLSSNGTSNILFRRKLNTINCLSINKTYTFIFTVLKSSYNGLVCFFGNSDKFASRTEIDFSKLGVTKVLATTKTDFSSALYDFYIYFPTIFTGEVQFTLTILEGDYTSKPIPTTAFEGLKSSFEGQLVTQEMVTAGTEKAENLGKYKVMTKVRGKNLLDNNFEYGLINSLTGENSTVQNDRFRSINYAKVNNGVTYKFSTSVNVHEYDINKKYIKSLSSVTSFTCDFNGYIRIHGACTLNADLTKLNIQLEEGTVATPYEPYFERTQAVYLTSPLLKGDEIVLKDDGLYHLHNRGKTVLNENYRWNFWTNNPGDTVNFYVNNYEDGLIHRPIPNESIIATRLPNNQGGYISTVEGIRYTQYFTMSINKSKLGVVDINDTVTNKPLVLAWLKVNPIDLIYKLAEPYCEKIADYPIKLESPNNATLSVESVIPCTTLKSTYTGSVPSVYTLEETSTQNSSYISDTQIAVDYLLMNNMSAMTMTLDIENNTGLTKKGESTMGAYFASRIMRGFLDYKAVVTKYPEFKDDIDFILRSEGREDLITV